MPSEPTIDILPHKHRSRVFWFLVVVFLVSLPAMIFYTAGYRLNFDEETSIVTTGGMYITTDNLDVDVYLDGEKIEKPRLFRSAYYIQQVAAGQRRVVVQGAGMHTWVKELPIDPHIVVEAVAFTLPVVPQVRPITPYVTATNTPVFFVATSTTVFPGATTTVPVIQNPKLATSTLNINEEFLFVESLFGTTSTTSRSVFERLLDEVDRFRFATTSDVQASSTEVEEEVIERGDLQLLEKDKELYAVWSGSVDNIPYYFCVATATSTQIATRYGDHVAAEFARQKVSTTTAVTMDGNRMCREEVKLDRKRQDVYFYDFFPNNTDLVLLQLEDGLYVTEIDDRAWQNTQQIYASDTFQVVVENGTIFIHDNGKYFELVTEIESN